MHLAYGLEAESLNSKMLAVQGSHWPCHIIAMASLSGTGVKNGKRLREEGKERRKTRLVCLFVCFYKIHPQENSTRTLGLKLLML